MHHPRLSRRMALAACLGLGLSGCAPLPDFATATRAAAPGPAPVLVPIDGLLAQADALGNGAAATAPVTARAEQLRARADRLRRE
ncbi:hypothetical protein [Pseudotabrizicola algicola]|uniref:Uncharacterized protein n=1 Tax=Pseudotabrizicola algicola TaxID=2709381 RepID=A0A6B3RNY1_9RHOB|nr:hypothetical protein [Pseudotabrizicola algicola]NEX47780.1 hypothetical protein [Pseudotabrizicola algicola]